MKLKKGSKIINEYDEIMTVITITDISKSNDLPEILKKKENLYSYKVRVIEK